MDEITVAEYQRVVKNNGILEAELARVHAAAEEARRDRDRASRQLQEQWAWFVALLKEFANGSD